MSSNDRVVPSEWEQVDGNCEWCMRIGNIVATAWGRGDWNIYAYGNGRARLAGGTSPDALDGAMRGAEDALCAIGQGLISAASHRDVKPYNTPPRAAGGSDVRP